MKFPNFGKIVATFFLTAFLATGPMMTSPSYALDAAQKAEFEALIRSYILENPEILLEAQKALEAKRELQAKVRTEKVLKEQHDIIFASKNQFEIGNPKGDITVVEFFDYNCAFCKRAMDDMNTLLENDKKLKFILKELPILSEASATAHQISIAVGRLAPEKYGEFHRKLLGGNGLKDGTRAIKLAETMGMDIEKILKISKQADVMDAFREVSTLARDLGINGTPSYVIGDEVIFGALGADVLRKKIENVRKCGSTTCS
jgi:protein-disulfide isomerase